MKKRLPSRRPLKSGGKPPRSGRGIETILLVDHDQVSRANLSKVLAERGYEVLQAGDGEEALALSVRYRDPIRLLITDVMMPVMNGKDLAERLCSLRPEIRVLYVSGYTRNEVLSGNGNSGKEHWLPKPFTAAQLVAKVKRVLGSGRQD